MTNQLDGLVTRLRETMTTQISSRATRAQAPTLHLCGLNHTRASVELREHYAMDDEGARSLTQQIREAGLANQVLVLSTCNRTEVYVWSEQPRVETSLRELFLGLGEAACPESGPSPIYQYQGLEAVRHLFAVTSGLDSMILGENQIKNQLCHAREMSAEFGSDGKELHQTIDKAFSTAKRIKTETRLNIGTLCVGKAAVLQAEKRLEGLAGRRCLIIGAGKIGRIAATALAERQIKDLWIVNRTRERATALAEELGGTGYGLDALPALLPKADVIIGAAYSRDLLLDFDDFRRFCPPCEFLRRIALVDVAVPRMIDPRIGELPAVTLDNIEMMEEIVENNRRLRAKEASNAWLIIEDEVEKFRNAQVMATLGPRIRQLQKQIDRVFEEEAPFGEVSDKVTQARVHRVKQRLMHEIITDMKSQLV